MRYQIDLKILGVKFGHRLSSILGKDFISRIRFYIKRFYAEI